MAWSIFTNGGGPLVAVGWAKQFLQYIGAPVTPGNVEFVYQWEKSEGGGGQYNPLNVGPLSGHTDLLVPGDTGSHFGGGAADYNSWQSGLLGAKYGVELPAYSSVLKNLRSNNPTAARAALWASPWAASHYGYGSNWYFGAVPSGAPVLPGPGVGSTGGSGGGTTETLIPGPNHGETCAWKLTLPSIGPVGGGDWCILSKTQVRAILAIGLGVLAMGTGLVGAVLLVTYGLRSGAEKATAIAGFIPGAGTAVRAAKATPAMQRKPVQSVSPAANKASATPRKAPASKPAETRSGGRHRAEDRYGRHAAPVE